MNENDDICLCFHVPLRKIRTFLARENPPVASLISECLGAGTGCQWCVPFLKHLHAMHVRGEIPDLKVSPEEYVRARLSFHKTGERDPEVVREADDDQPSDDPATDDQSSDDESSDDRSDDSAKNK